MNKILIYGYGNPGRQDDGLGAQFVEIMENWIQEMRFSHINTDTNYQLNIEDAAMIAGYDTVFFVDASVVEDVLDYKLEVVRPDSAHIEFTMHAVSVSYVLDLCNKIYDRTPETFVLHIRAYDFDFKEELTAAASVNLKKATEFLKEYISGKYL